jgi:glycosyltransferase involved in cell wall biosynthesis
MSIIYDVTIGIPVYNVGHYIQKGLESALSQQFQGTIEVLVIDDCGTDFSMNIINEMKETHPNGQHIHIIKHQKNMGVGVSRNDIIKNANGKYLFFLDADDFISLDCINILYSHAEENQSDVVYGSGRTVNHQGEPIDIGMNYLSQPQMIFNKENELASYAFQDTHIHLRDYIVNILFNRSFLLAHHLFFPEIRFHEDVVFSADFVPLVKKAILLPDLTYSHVIRNNSLSNYQGREMIDLKEIEDFISIYTYIKDKNISLKDKPYYEARCARSMAQMFFIISGALKNRHIIKPNLTIRMLKKAMKHPIPLKEILRFKKFKLNNLMYYSIGIMPNMLSVATIFVVAKIKHLI